MSNLGFKLTYATMFNPPEQLHTAFDEALANVKANVLGKTHPCIINGKEVTGVKAGTFKKVSPINNELVLGNFQLAGKEEADAAIDAAAAAFPAWAKKPWQERVKIMRKAADLIDENLIQLTAITTMEVGKNRMEALGDVAEVSDLVRHACDMLEKNNGFIVPMASDPLIGYKATNVSYLHPYGVWLVISPFNFPGALTGGPAGAALAAGNTVVIKPATDTPFIPYMISKLFIQAGLPDGVLNFVTGSGSTVGQALIENPKVGGITFTGSYPVGMKIYRDFAAFKYARPCILELGGKNCCIVSKKADLDVAALGLVRSAFGLQGQKCSACSRILVEAPVYDELVAKILEQTKKLTIGDPTIRANILGPVINKNSYAEYQEYCAELKKSGKILIGGDIITTGEFAKGFFCQPTLAELPLSHPLWKKEMFLPITTISKVDSLDHAMKIANDVDYGLTAGFYGPLDESQWFFENIAAGTVYANRPFGATTGAWPGFQTFGGWKCSGSSGKNAGGPYYVTCYMHEQSRTLIEKL